MSASAHAKLFLGIELTAVTVRDVRITVQRFDARTGLPIEKQSDDFEIDLWFGDFRKTITADPESSLYVDKTSYETWGWWRQRERRVRLEKLFSTVGFEAESNNYTYYEHQDFRGKQRLVLGVNLAEISDHNGIKQLTLPSVEKVEEVKNKCLELLQKLFSPEIKTVEVQSFLIAQLS